MTEAERVPQSPYRSRSRARFVEVRSETSIPESQRASAKPSRCEGRLYRHVPEDSGFALGTPEDTAIDQLREVRCGDFTCCGCGFHLYVPLIYIICISFRLNDKRVTATQVALSLFLSSSIREYMERSSQASHHPLRNPRKSAVRRDRLRQRSSDLKRCRGGLFAVQKVSSSRLSPAFRCGHSGRTLSI